MLRLSVGRSEVVVYNSSSTEGRMREEIDPYKVLGVSRDASYAEIKRAHKRLRRKFHPDLFPHGGDKDLWEHANWMFVRVQSAWEMLDDPAAHPGGDIEEDEPPHLRVYDVISDLEVDPGHEAVVQFKVDLVSGTAPDNPKLTFDSEEDWLKESHFRVGRIQPVSNDNFFPLLVELVIDTELLKPGSDLQGDIEVGIS